MAQNTPGVPDPEVSAMKMRAKTAAFPDQEDGNYPRIYGQHVPAPESEPDGDDDDYMAKGTGPAYGD